MGNDVSCRYSRGKRPLTLIRGYFTVFVVYTTSFSSPSFTLRPYYYTALHYLFHFIIHYFTTLHHYTTSLHYLTSLPHHITSFRNLTTLHYLISLPQYTTSLHYLTTLPYFAASLLYRITLTTTSFFSYTTSFQGEACGLVKNLALLAHVTNDEESENDTLRSICFDLGEG